MGRRPVGRLIAILILLVAASAVRGQAPPLPADFVRPTLVLNGQGHTASLRVLAFSPDGKYLISAGLDKVIHVWEFREGHPRLDRTIRPPIRRLGGAIYAAAVSAPDRENQRLLAVAGFGAIGNSGDILVFRLPGKNDAGTGDLAFVLAQGSMLGPDHKIVPVEQRRGHSSAVLGLAFSPSNRYLASCSDDKTIRVWDMEDARHPSVAVLTGHKSQVRRVAFVDEDRVISASGGAYASGPNAKAVFDGSLRVWAWRNAPPSVVDEYDVPGASPINAMAITRDGGTVVVGRENGSLERYSTSNLKINRWLNPQGTDGRAVEAVALSPDGHSFAASTLKNRPPRGGELEFPSTECEVAIRRVDDGLVIEVPRVTSDLARAIAFSPDGRFLAIGGGGSQEVAVKDLKDPNAPVIELNGPSTVLWDVGFVDVDSKPTVAYARKRPLARGQTVWEGFDLPRRRFVAVDDPRTVAGALTATPGWSLGTPDTRRLIATPAGGDPVVLPLARDDLRWTSYTFIPGNDVTGHPKLTVAIGCTGGTVVLYSLPDGKKTRVFLGHSGPVHAVAPSPDGRWLASVSADMTVRLWPLAGCDARPALGARLERDAQGNWFVRDVAVRSFAQEIGLTIGDRVLKVSQRMVKDRSELAGATIVKDAQGNEIVTDVANSSPARAAGIRVGDRVELSVAGIGGVFRELAIERLDTEIDAIEPGSAAIDVEVRPQTVRAPVAGGAAGAVQPAVATYTTTRKDRPALSLMPGTDREWIVWMPEGYYDTSIAGDRRLLGWHINKVNVANPLGLVPLVSEFYPMSRFERQLHRPAVIDRLLQTGDVVAALNAGQGAVVVEPPPTIRIVTPANVLAGAEMVVARPQLTLRVEAAGGSANRGIRSIVVHNNTAAYPASAFDRPAPRAEATHEIKLLPNENAISVVATDDRGVEQIARMRVKLDVPPGPPANAPGSRLVIRSIGIEKFDAPAIKPIEFAVNDALTLADFLEAPDTKRRFNRIDKPILANGRTTSHELAHVFESLSNEVRGRSLGAGDTVFVVIETHLIKRGPMGLMFLGSDANAQSSDQTAIDAETISHCLEELAAEGCLVIVLLDGIHERELSIAATQDITAWVRDLNRRKVFVMVASKQEKSLRPAALGMSAFVRAIKDSVTVAGGSRSGARLTVDEFRTAVIRRVAELTSRSQFADLYPPEILDQQTDRIRIFEPQGRAAENLAGK